MIQEKKLNPGQEAAANEVLSFLLSPEKEMCISGPGGSGKTFLMGHLIDSIIPTVQEVGKMLGAPDTITDVAMTATTNKAAEQLGKATGRPTGTVHSEFGFVLKPNFKTGNSDLIRGKKWKERNNTVFFVDEGYCADSILRDMVVDSCIGSKIIWVGDHCQMGPVKETMSPIYNSGLRTAYLTESVRNKDQPALQAICAQLRRTVETGVFEPIKEVPGVIDFYFGNDFATELTDNFQANSLFDNKVVAYSNDRVIQYCEFIRELRNLPEHFTEGEKLVNNSAVQLGNSGNISVEEEVEIVRIDEHISKVHVGTEYFEARYADLRTDLKGTFTDLAIPTDMAHFRALTNWFKNQKKWHEYFKMKEQFPDLRMREASTVHKAQGSTHDTIYIDLGNLSTCNIPLVVARLLYVAFSRAKTRVVCYGELASKYGGLIRATP